MDEEFDRYVIGANRLPDLGLPPATGRRDVRDDENLRTCERANDQRTDGTDEWGNAVTLIRHGAAQLRRFVQVRKFAVRRSQFYFSTVTAITLIRSFTGSVSVVAPAGMSIV